MTAKKNIEDKIVMAIINQLFDLSEVPVVKRRVINDRADEYLAEELEAYAALAVAEATKDCYPKEFVIAFTDWLDKLQPSQRTSVWSKNGEYKGLFTMDNEQLLENFKERVWKENVK